MKDVLFQGFEWYLPNDGRHWQRLAELAPELARLGVGKIWLPPAFKGTSQGDVGYGVYDLFDIGEFDQKGTVRTKYGFKDDFLAAIRSFKAHGIAPLADLVLNHKAGADSLETFPVVEVDAQDRTQVLTQPFELTGWTHFTFPGRGDVYDNFHWHWYHFTGTDYDAATGKSGIYEIMGPNKGWAQSDLVDRENGNYDYLMYADLDFKHPEVVQNIYDWADWFIDTTGISGFRLDAIKHIDAYFMNNFIYNMTQKYGEDFYVFGEYWNGQLADNERYLESIHYSFDLIDTRLHMNFYEAGKQGQAYDLREIFTDSLVANHPQTAVTFVDNHDTQQGQALESWVADWFKPAAYALILLRESGLPCVFYGDYVGVAEPQDQVDFRTDIGRLLQVRQGLDLDQEEDYFDQADCIGWTRQGTAPGQALAVLISNDQPTSKNMAVGEAQAGLTFYDILGNISETVTLDEQGYGNFPVAGQSVSVWVPESFDID